MVFDEHFGRMKRVTKEKLYTHLMIETRLMIPETISMIQDCFDKKLHNFFTKKSSLSRSLMQFHV